MTFSTALMRLVAGSFMLLLVTASLPLLARPVDQPGWEARKQNADLPNGMTLAYVEMGDPQGSPVVLLHGWTDSSRSWTIVAPHLMKYRLLIPDLRGHGGSAKPDCCYAIADFAHDVTLLMDHAGVERAAIVGHSLGSMVAQRIAADHPDRVDKLVLIGSTALAPITRGDWAWTSVTALTAPIDPAHPFIRDFTSSPTPVDPVFARHALAETIATPLHVWQGVLRELADVPVGRFAADIDAPTLILAGEADAFFDASHQQALRDAIPHARYRMFPELGHNLIWERPEIVGPELAGFLDQNARK